MWKPQRPRSQAARRWPWVPLPEKDDPYQVSSKGLEEKLRMLAERHPEGPDLTSTLDWNAPGNVPDLALFALLRLNLAAFAELHPEACKRRFQTLPLEHFNDPMAPTLAGMYLLSIAFGAPDRLAAAADTLIDALTVRTGDPVLVALALGQVYVHAQSPGQELAREKLLALAERAPFSEDPRMRELVGFFGLKGGGSDA